MRPPNALALPFLLAAGAAAAATFMPWGTVSGEFTNMASFMAGMSFTVDAWNSSVTALVVKLPNWTPALVACALAAWAWFGAPPSRWVGVAILYGLLHAVGAAYFFYRFGGGTFGLGVLVTFGAFVAMAATLRRRRSASVVEPT